MILNSSKFRQAAIHFQKYGYYTSAPKGTTAYKAYWDEETKRCLYGWTSDDGDFITGYNYFYLNYSPIQRVIEKEIKIGSDTKKSLERTRDFPTFYDTDYHYFLYLQEAEEKGKHGVVLKKRRAGYSFKASSMLCRNFYLIPGSLSVAVASEAEFLTKDGILTKAWDLMSWLDQNTAWTKKRQKIDTKMHKRASYIVDKDGTKIEAGFLSEIMGVTVKNDVQKIRGKAAKLILFEEAGKFPGLKEAWQIARPSVEQGSNVFGTMIAYGTGGTEDADYEGLKDLFYECDAYNVLGVDNVWDEGASNTKCGFFVPECNNMEGCDEEGVSFMDDNGNSRTHIAIKHILKERQKIIDVATDRSAIDRYIAEHPLTPMEACLQISGNIFPKKDLIRHLAYIKNNTTINSYKQVGELFFDEQGVLKWKQDSDIKALTKYRLGKEDSREGAVVIWEHPMDKPPYGMYIAGCDPYDHNQSGTDSLGSIFIYKRFTSFEYTYDLIVAEYTGRPDTAEQFYEIVRKMLLYYNAKLLYENQNPGLATYFRHKHCDYMLADQPDILSKILKNSKVERGKGIHMTVDIKNYAEGRLRDWLVEEYEPGKKNLTKIYSEALLEELISYNDKGNFDRVMAMFSLFIYKDELYNHAVRSKEEVIKRKHIFDSPLFSTEDKDFFSFNY